MKNWIKENWKEILIVVVWFGLVTLVAVSVS